MRDSALVLGNLDGTHRHPGRFSRRFVAHVVQARRALGEEQLPMIRLHDLRHPRDPAAGAGEPVKVVSERLGHASATITLTVHQHVHPGMGGKPRTASSHCSTIDGDTAPEPPSITAV